MPRGQNVVDRQLTIPGLRPTTDDTATPSPPPAGRLGPGAVVVYRGRVRGGPRFGAKGVVREVRGRRVVVNLAEGGVWHIPAYFLRGPLRPRPAARTRSRPRLPATAPQR